MGEDLRASAPSASATGVGTARRRRLQEKRATARRLNWLFGVIQATASHHTTTFNSDIDFSGGMKGCLSFKQDKEDRARAQGGKSRKGTGTQLTLEEAWARAAARGAKEKNDEHRLSSTGPFRFCQRCGAYARRGGSGALAAKCQGRPGSKTAGLRLRRLSEGKDPISGVPVARNGERTQEELKEGRNELPECQEGVGEQGNLKGAGRAEAAGDRRDRTLRERGEEGAAPRGHFLKEQVAAEECEREQVEQFREEREEMCVQGEEEAKDEESKEEPRAEQEASREELRTGAEEKLAALGESVRRKLGDFQRKMQAGEEVDPEELHCHLKVLKLVKYKKELLQKDIAKSHQGGELQEDAY